MPLEYLGRCLFFLSALSLLVSEVMVARRVWNAAAKSSKETRLPFSVVGAAAADLRAVRANYWE